MSKYKFELRYGSSKAPVKVICFISASCTHCAELMTKDLPALKSLASSGKFEIAFFPFVRNEIDEIVYVNLVSSGVNKEAGYISHAKYLLNSNAPSLQQYVESLKSNPQGILFKIEDIQDVRNSRRVHANLATVHLVGDVGWKLSKIPAAIVNGLVMYDPHRGRLVRSLKKLSRFV